MAHFREVVEVIYLIGETAAMTVISEAKRYTARNSELARPFAASRVVEPVHGYLPPRMVTDPAGCFVVYVDRARGNLSWSIIAMTACWTR